MQKNKRYSKGCPALYRKINDYISEIKMCMYSLVVLLNLNILMSSERLRYPGNVLFCSEKKWELCDVDDDIKLSLYMTFFLGIFNLIGYFVIVGFLGLTEIPLMIRQTRRHAAKALCDPRISPSDYTDPSAFKIGCVFLIFVAFFVAIHLFNFKKNVPDFIYCIQPHLLAARRKMQSTLKQDCFLP